MQHQTVRALSHGSTLAERFAMTRALPALALALALALVDARPAAACSLVGTTEHQLDPAYANDITPPTEVTAAAEVHRSADTSGCGGVSSCGDLASISVTVDALDNAAPADLLGYQFRVVNGDVPEGLDFPTTAVQSDAGDQLYFYFNYDDRSGFGFDLEIRARDLNGNLGPPVVIYVSELQEGGCKVGGHASMLAGVLLALALLVLRRR